MSKKIAYYGIFSSLALLMGYVETIIQIPLPIPGIKLGLSNVVVLLAMYVMGRKEAFFISLIRIFLAAILFKGFLSFWYSLSGAMLSYLIMCIAIKFKSLSAIGVSVLGGVWHNIGQMIVAFIVLGRYSIIYLFPVLIITGVITGFGIGVVVNYTKKHLEQIKIHKL